MSWLVDISLVVGVLACGLCIFVQVNRGRFERRVLAETRSLTQQGGTSLRATPAELPPAVARYRQLAVGDHALVHTIRVRHRGTFQLSPTATPKPIRGEQVFTADAPGFIWTGRVRMAPGVWIDARDMLIAGKGSMRVLIDDTITVADARGAHIDQGSALRLLAEMVWFPTSLFDSRTVTWSEIDADHARATLRSGAQVVSCVFEFGSDGLPIGMTAERFNDQGVLQPWGGTYRDWRLVDGMRIPFEAEVAWLLATPYVYAHWLVDVVEYEPADVGWRTSSQTSTS